MKKKNTNEQGKIYFYDIGDYLDREHKLAKIKQLQSIAGIEKVNGFTKITPDEQDDWLNQTDPLFKKFLINGKLIVMI